MANPVQSGSVEEQAAQWAVEAACGELTAEARDELESWLAADRRHRGAYTRARAVFLAMENAVVSARSAAPGPVGLANEHPTPIAAHPPRMRRRGMAFGGALAACLAMVAVVGVLMSAHAGRSGLTGERIVTLQDGSVATLLGDARINVVLSQDARRVTLLSGDATFRVAKDQDRPFVVQAGEVYAQATGTVYSVARVGTRGGAVKVKEGSVLVWPGEQREQAILLHAGDTLTLDPALRTPPHLHPEKAPNKGPRPPASSAQIALDDTPIRVAVARFNRINATKIVLADPEIGEIRIVGLFKADDPAEFARMAAAVSGGEVEQGRGAVVIKMR